MRRYLAFSVVILTAVLCVSCFGKKGNSNESQTTGWAYNNPDNGGFQVMMDVRAGNRPRPGAY